MFAHRLVASGIGGQTVFDLSDNMDIDEFYRWLAYDKLFPIGLEDVQFGLLKRLLASIYTQKGRAVPKLQDLIIGEMPETKLTADEIEARMEIWVGNRSADDD